LKVQEKTLPTTSVLDFYAVYLVSGTTNKVDHQ